MLALLKGFVQQSNLCFVLVGVGIFVFGRSLGSSFGLSTTAAV
jgi:hypothetical protein